jgi:hypothetical protein
LKTFRLLLLSALPLFAFSGCPTKPAGCDPTTCTSGCCDANGQCQLGASGEACGTGGQLCTACFPGQLCSQGLCMAGNTGGGSGGGGGGTGTGGGTTTGPLMCAAGKTACSGSCVDLRSDERNCGNCGTLCNSNQFCSNSACAQLPTGCAGGCPTGFFCTPGNECKPGCAANADCPQPGSCDTRINLCTCATGFHQCGETCDADNNISACGPSCASCDGVQNAVPACANNRCDFTCNPGLHRCGNECKPNNDTATCGTSCTPCTPPPNSVAICASEMCDFVCNSGFHRCGNACVSNTSVNSCGTSSCTACAPPPNGTATCNGFACDFTCNAGFHRCGNSCVSNTSVNSCGNACSPCAPPSNSTATCNGTSCGFTCNTGAHACGGACVSNNSVSSCGTTSCTPCSAPLNGTSTCNGVACDFTCNTGTHRCGSSCSDNTSVSSCGTSCNVCPAGPANSTRTCNGVSCGWQCNAGFHDCGGACVSDSSVTQCGLSCTSCPVVANGVPVCSSGTCNFSCNAGFHRCGNACVSNSDVDSCGTTSCTPCPNGPANSTRTCNGTSCGFLCGGGFNACNGECVPPDFASACGVSCAACPANGTFDRPICSTGSCGTACITSCSAACVDVTRDPANCGSCGTACSGGQVCSGSECRTSCATGPAFEGVLPFVSVSAASNYRLLAEDLNADGRVDLVDNGSTAGLHVRYSNADGTFQAPVLVGTASNRPNAFVLVDVNADGRKDIVATLARTSTSNVFVSLNTGTGFGTAAALLMSGYTPSGVILVGDFTGDTRPDLAVPATSTYIFYFPQTTTDGVFPAAYQGYSSNTLQAATSGRVGDFNKDGRPDFVLATSSQYQVAIHSGASVTVSGHSAMTPGTVGNGGTGSLTGIASLEVADLNADTNLDFLMRTSAGASFVLGTGTSTFGAAATAVTFSGTPNGPIIPVDLNGDTMLDLVAGTTGSLYVSLATAQGVWPAPSTRLINAAPTGQFSIAAGQLVGSAAPEVFSANQSSTSVQVSIMVNEGGGQLLGARSSGVSVTSTAAASGDVDGDGDRDLVVTAAIATGGTGTGTVLLGGNNGGFGVGTTVTLRGDEFVLGRLSGDAFADLAAIIESTTTPGVDVFIGGAGGTFGAPTRVATTSLPTKLVIANLDSDSIADLVVGTTTGVEWFHGNGDGTFGAAVVTGAAQGTVQALAVGDLNLDGKADLVVNSGTSASLRVYLGYGAGAFQLQPFASYATSASATDVIISDLDRDGRPDVAVATSGGVMLFHGDGNGQLQGRTTQTTMVGRLAVTDLDSDGFVDLVNVNSAGELQIARGQTGMTFLPKQGFAPGRTLVSTSVLVDKFNNDSFPDVLVLTTGSETWTYLGTCR